MQHPRDILKDEVDEENFEEGETGTLDPPDVSRSCVGQINISFPEAISEFGETQDFPPPYYTLSAKERLLLLYAENFRHQFVITNYKSRPLVLALPNECNIQKFVCTTIRPTSFPHMSLRTAEGIASFVADFIIYEPLDETLSFPSRLISPATLLRTRRGNSFEMATLLCSMLIGVGFTAVVVSGVARTEVVENDQRDVSYPSAIYDFETQRTEGKFATVKQFSLGAMPDLESQLERNIAEVVKQKVDEKQRKETLKREQEELELRAADRYHCHRLHSWVAIIESAFGIMQPKESFVSENGDVVVGAAKARFIESSTGFFRSSNCMEYILIDSVWDQNQYYVNKQKYVYVGDIRWELKNLQDWEPILPGEHSENIANNEYGIMKERHLNTIPSWVSKLHIGEKEFEERFPHLQKIVFYKRVKHQRFSPYFNRDGKVTQLTLFADNVYKEPIIDWMFFENRADMLLQVKLHYKDSEIEDNFGKGRKDNLKCMRSNMSPNKPKELFFFPKVRRDSTEYLKIECDRIIVRSRGRRDLCFYQEFEFDPDGQNLKKITQKFSRKTNLPAEKDIAERTFFITQEKIHLKFHYAPGALTASTCEITKPSKPDYGLEVIYDKSLSKYFKANIADPEPLQLDMYRIMMDQLNNEERSKRYFKILSDEIRDIFYNRRIEMEKHFLIFRVFDSMRNGAARSKRLKQVSRPSSSKRLKRLKCVPVRQI